MSQTSNPNSIYITRYLSVDLFSCECYNCFNNFILFKLRHRNGCEDDDEYLIQFPCLKKPHHPIYDDRSSADDFLQLLSTYYLHFKLYHNEVFALVYYPYLWILRTIILMQSSEHLKIYEVQKSTMSKLFANVGVIPYLKCRKPNCK